MSKEWKNAEIEELQLTATAANPPVPNNYDGVLNADGSVQSGVKGWGSGSHHEIVIADK
ncbi:MAG: hypothetical protein IKN95_00980 [Lachnospiraceae bacterium]|nr:hypothetical protein [Lachnospiraceae bacterium]